MATLSNEQLLKDLQEKLGMAMLLITHDLGVVARMADRIGVMYAGQLVEEAPRREFFAQPAHPYSVRLFAALPGGCNGFELGGTPQQVQVDDGDCVSGGPLLAESANSW